jgi:tetratricopeptide (TPR) repeat protein
MANQAEHAARQALEEEPRSDVAMNILGCILNFKGDFAGALAAHQKALALKGSTGDTKLLCLQHFNIGNSLAHQGDQNAAIAAYRRGISADPLDGPVHVNLGGALYKTGDLEGASKILRRAILLDTCDSKAHAGLGRVLRALGDTDGAMKSLRKAIAISRNTCDYTTEYLDNVVALSHLMTKRGDMIGAISMYRHAIEIDPHCSQAHGGLGAALCSTGDCKGAITSCKRAIAIDPHDITAILNLANAYGQAGDFQRVIATCKDAIAIDPGSVDAHEFMAQAIALSRPFQG